MKKPELGAILLAAGGSARLGRSKQRLQLGGEFLVRRAARLLLELGPSYLAVVTGAEADAVAGQLQSLPLSLVRNRHWKRGMGTSIATAAKQLPESLDGVLIMLCDQWRLTESDLAGLVCAWQARPSGIVVSQWTGPGSAEAFGPPVIFPRDLFGELRSLQGDKGARGVIAENPDRTEFVPLDNARFDLDRPEDLDLMNARSAGFELRPIREGDNRTVAAIIRQVMAEYDAVGCNYSSADPELDAMYQAYPAASSAFFVVEQQGKIVGCGGMSPLRGGDPGICELQKMYLLPETRGSGQGARLLAAILQAARDAGYRQCYLETLERMSEARRLYEKHGFEYIDSSLGDTGHSGCNWWMIKTL